MASISWLFGIGGDWSTAVDWSGGIAPGSADDVTIDASGTYTVMIGTTAEAANSLTLDAAGATLAITEALTVGTTLDAAAGTLSLGSGGSLNGGTVIAGGAAMVFAGGTLNGLTWEGALTLGATGAALTVANGVTLTGAGGSGPGTVSLTGTSDSLTVSGILAGVGAISLTGTSDNLTSSGTVTDAGALTLGAGNSFVESSGTVTIGAASTDAGDLEVQNGGVAGVTGDFTNTGTFGLHDSGLVTIGGDFTNGDSLDVDNVRYETSTFYGTYYNEGGSSLTIAGTLDNTGTVQVGNTSQALDAETTVTLSALVNGNGASFTLYGSASYAATLAFSGAGFTSNGGDFELTYAASLTLNSGFINSGTFALHNNTTLSVSGDFTNTGTLNVDNVRYETSTFYGTYYNEGGSSLAIAGTLDNTGAVQVGNTSLGLDAPTALTIGGLINGSGTSFQVEGSASDTATLAFTGGSTEFTSNGGNFALAYAAPIALKSSFINSGTLSLSDNTALTLTGDFTNTGTFGLHDSGLVTIGGDFTNGDSLDVDNVRYETSTFYGTYYNEGGSNLTIAGTLDNTGTVQVGNTSQALDAETTVTLSALVNGNGASFTLYGSASYAATLAFSGAGFTSNGGDFELTYAASLTLNSGFINSGTFALHNNTTLSVSGDFTNTGTLNVDNVRYETSTFYGTYYNEGGSSLAIAGTLDNTGAVQVGNTSLGLDAPTALSAGAFINGGSASFALYGSSSYAATLTVSGPAANAGALDIASYAALVVTGGNAFTQAGTSATTTVNGTLTAPTIDIDGGTLAIDTTNFTDTGTLVAADGGLINFSGGGLTNLSGTTLTGGTYEVDAGSTMEFASGVTIAADNADIILNGTASVIESGATSLNAQLTSISTTGALHLISGASFNTATAFFDSGLIDLEGGTFAAGGLVVTASGTVFGTGTLATVAQTENDGTIEASGGDLFVSHDIDGTGSLVIDNAATLELAGASAESITFNPAGATGTALVGGTLLLDSGGSFTGALPSAGINSVTNNGSIGTGVQLAGGGSVVNGTSGNTDAIINGGTYGVQFGGGSGTLTNAGTITGATGVVFGNNSSNGTLTNSGTIEGTGGVAVSFGGTNDVLINQSGGTLVGAVDLNQGANLTVATQITTQASFAVVGSPSMTATSTIAFQTTIDAPVVVTLPDVNSGGGGVVDLSDPSASVDSNPDISDLGDGNADNAIEIAGGGDDGADIEGGDGGDSGSDPSAVLAGAGGAPAPGSTIVVTSGGTIVARIPLLENLVGRTVHLSHPSPDTTVITVSCFATGTRILTTCGEVAVEDLCAGAMVPTVNRARPQPVIWIGQRRIDTRRHKRPAEVWPVRVRTGALGDGRPARDILLSPDHSLFIADALIPVRYLINCVTVLQEPAEEVIYFHVELPEHGVILADGLPVESYLDAGNRGDFDNGSGALTEDRDLSNRG